MNRSVATSKRSRRNYIVDASAAAGTQYNGPLDELMGCVSRLRVDARRAPLEPQPLSLNATPDAFACPLSLRIVAPRALTADDVTFDVTQPWCSPHRLVRIAVRAPVEYESLESADWSAAIQSFVGNMRLTANLDMPPKAAVSSARTHMRLETAVHVSSDSQKHGRCVLIEVPVPAGITLRPGSA